MIAMRIDDREPAWRETPCHHGTEGAAVEPSLCSACVWELTTDPEAVLVANGRTLYLRVPRNDGSYVDHLVRPREVQWADPEDVA